MNPIIIYFFIEVSIYASLLLSALGVVDSSKYVSIRKDGIYNIIFSQDFEHHNAPIEYTTKIWNPDWNNPGWRDGDHRRPSWFAENIKDSIIVDDETGSRVMQFNFTDTIVDGWSGVAPYRCGDYWKVNLGFESKELYFSYNVKFRPGFMWNKGGKLPATNGGSPLNKKTQADCIRPGEGEGYSSAIMFRSNGRLCWYLFYQDQENDQWGDSHYWDDFQPEGLRYTENGEISLDVSVERWYNITLRVVVNSFTNGKPNKDGLMEGFVDGKLVSSLTGLYLLTEIDKDKGVNQLSLGHFFGGNEPYQGPLRDEWTLFDDFICFTYDESIDVPRGNTPSSPGRVLELPNLKSPAEEPKDVDPPSVPNDVKIVRTTESMIDLKWSPSKDNTSVEGYRIFVNGQEDGITKDTFYTIKELKENTQYSLTLSSFDSFSNESSRSLAIFAKTNYLDTIPPSIPLGLEVTETTERTISVKWIPASDNQKIEGYRIFIDNIAVDSTDKTYFTVPNLQPDTQYEISVSSFDPSLNESQQSVSIIASTDLVDTVAPTIPKNISISLITQNSVEFSWENSTDNVSVKGYKVFLNGILNSRSPDNKHNIPNLSPGVNYSISISAFDNSSNESDESEEVYITTKNPNDEEVPILPNLRIIDVVDTPQSNSASVISEISSAGHSDLVDFGVIISEKDHVNSSTTRKVLYYDESHSELIHSNRITDGIQLMYDFTEGQGTIVYNRADTDNSTDLKVSNPLETSWISGQGLKINGSTMISSEQVPTALINSISISDEISFEAWIRTSTVNQSGPARIITLSKNNDIRIATLGQEGNHTSFSYSARLSTTETTDNGTPGVSAEEYYIDPHLHHVVYTRDNFGVEKIFVNGVERYSGYRKGRISNLDEENYLALANELSGERPWTGCYYLVAVYNKALSERDISQNYEAGTGVIRFTNSLDVNKGESYTITPFARSVQGISYGEPVDFSPEKPNFAFKDDSIHMTIYPNPSNGDFNIRLKLNVKKTPPVYYIRVADMMGQVVYNDRISFAEGISNSSYYEDSDLENPAYDSEFKINLSHQLKEGVYLVSLITDSMAIGRRLVVQY